MLKAILPRYFDPTDEFEEVQPIIEDIIDEYKGKGEELPLLLKAYEHLDEYPKDIQLAIMVSLIIRYKYEDARFTGPKGIQLEVLHVPDKFVEVSDNKKVRVDYRGLAKFIAKKFAVVYFNGNFYVWNGERYVDYDNIIDAVIYKHLLKCGFPPEKRATIYVAEVRKQIQYMCSVREFPFNKHNGYIMIPVKNGVIWWKDGEIELIPNSPVFGFTYCLNVNYIPNQKHDRIYKFLKSLVNEEDLEILYEIPASCLVRVHFPYAYFLYGTGSNGKSTYLNLITNLLGEENVSNVSLQDLSSPNTKRFRTAALIGKLANIFPDLPSTQLWSTDTFKALTGDDYITVEKKFKEPFSFKNTARLIFSANEFPRTKDESDAFWRRWIIVKFPNKFRNNPKFLEKLTTDEEKSAFLDEILKRLPRILECNPTINANARSEWIRNTDSVRAFLEDRVVEDKNSYVVKSELYNAYVEYCNEYGYDAVCENTFFRRINRMFPSFRPRVGGKQVRAYKGIRLKKDEEANSLSEFDEHKKQQEDSNEMNGDSDTNATTTNVDEEYIQGTKSGVEEIKDNNDLHERDDADVDKVGEDLNDKSSEIDDFIDKSNIEVREIDGELIEYVTVEIINLEEPTEIIGIDGEIYHIEDGDILTLPRANAEILIENAIALPVNRKV